MFLQELALPSLWDSARQLNLLQNRLNRLFSSLPETRQTEFPPVNVWASGEKAVVIAEVPGIDPDNIDVQITNQTVTLKTKREPDQLKDGQTWHRQERGYGQFTRSLELPFAIESDNIQAAYRDGVLRIELPRAKADLPKKITVKAS